MKEDQNSASKPL